MFTNIAAYQFIRLDGLKELRSELLPFCRSRDLKGTILLAPEGINLFVAGRERSIQDLLERLRLVPGLAQLSPKFSSSQEQPFARMLVRLKREIVAFGVTDIDPAARPAPRLSAATLKQWLDEKRPLVLLDTRNHYEVRMGTFGQALQLDIEHFRQFPEAARKLPEGLKKQPLVTFCTGGIRCEKAAPLLQRLGFEQVWQLDGGILKYFEEVGADHFEGECFVFDRRAGVDPALSETDSVICHACLAPLSAAQQSDSRYRPGLSCPYCFQPAPGPSLQQRQHKLDQACQPLPGRSPAENRRPLRIPERLDGALLSQVLAHLFAHIDASTWEELSRQGRLLDPTGQPTTLQRRVRSGEQYVRLERDEIEPDVNPRVQLLYEDEALLVLDKPAPLPMHSCGRFHRNTLRHLLQLAWHPQSPRLVHRLDANTTGVVVCARSHHFARLLQLQFAAGQVDKIYLARVHGHPSEDSFVVDIAIGEEAGVAGIRAPGAGRAALTHFAVRERKEDGTSLLEARPGSGRTNQIRAHLWSCGYPIVGDPAYQRHGLGDRQTLGVNDPPMQLHSWKISLQHPQTGQTMEFSTHPPWVREPEPFTSPQ